MTTEDLLIEIEEGPLAAELAPLVAAGDDAGAAAVLNRRDIPARSPVPLQALSAYCAVTGVTGGVLALDSLPVADLPGADLPAKLQIKGLLGSVLTIIQFDYRLETADLDDPAAAAMIGGLEAVGVLSAGVKAGMLALADGFQSRAEEAFGRAVSVDEVSRAMSARRPGGKVVAGGG